MFIAITVEKLLTKPVKFERYEADKYISVLRKLLDDITSSNIFGMRKEMR